ncbi:MAG: Crp/Fnr family transcriptional regulator [Chromatiales bacterium]|jgi:CRP-like cAMP-binding protein|nr:Crp/Fnr family transcriptional regulator [Chromatiales bacterium]MDX9767282.1 Crp/Fnr family transcriptional regulator [Ectothiorhodospiraceae bacterium]
MKDDLKTGLLFSNLSDAQLERIAQHAARLRLAAGESLFEQGDAADRFYLVLKGQIKLYRLSPAGNEKVIEVVTAGSTFAEALMFLDRPRYPVGAQALTAAEVISIDAHDFAAMLRGSVDTCFLLLGDMSQRLRGLLREIDELSLHSATCRVAAYFVQQAPADAQTFDLGIAKQVLASRLSVKPETLSRIIKNLSDDGIIAVTGSRITIHDRKALQQAADVCALPQDSLQSTFLYPCPPARTQDQ